MKHKETESVKFLLSAENIDRISDTIAQSLEEAGTNRKDILRLRLSAEDVLALWARELGENSKCELFSGSRFGRSYLIVSCEGRPVDPTRYECDEDLLVSGASSMMSAMGMVAEYSYSNGINSLRINLPRKTGNGIAAVLAVIVASVVFGAVFRFWLPEAGNVLNSYFLTPVFDAIMRLIMAVAGPLIFISVLSGIVNMGDRNSFSKIGKGLVLRFVGITFLLGVILIIPMIAALPFTPGGGMAGDGASVFTGFLNLILNIISQNVIEPFQTGNALQIILVAVLFGIACLILGEAVPTLTDTIRQLNSVVQTIMTIVSKVLPLFIFLCLSRLIISSDVSQLVDILIPLAAIIAAHLLITLITAAVTSARTKIPVMTILRLQLPCYITALTTNSSAAAFSLNIECCENLGIDRKLINLGVPLGQVIFMPGVVAEVVIMSFYMMFRFGVEITALSAFTVWIAAALMAIAAPPVPGGFLAVISMLCSQIGLPAEAVALCATISLFTGYFSTATNISGLQHVLCNCAKDMGMLGRYSE